MLHGLPPDAESVRERIVKIKSDDEWSQLSHQKIADHIGVSRRRVSQIISEIEDEENAKREAHSHIGINSSTTAESGQKSGNDANTVKKDTTVNKQPENKNGREEKKRIGAETRAAALVSDSVGRNVPDEVRDRRKTPFNRPAIEKRR